MNSHYTQEAAPFLRFYWVAGFKPALESIITRDESCVGFRVTTGNTEIKMTTGLLEWFEGIYFARHETFCPRYSWLKKGFDGVLSDPGIFDRPDAIELLGVGKNMVRSIRFWCMAFNITRPISDKKPLRVAGLMKVTSFGKKLFTDKTGWDPFAEDIGTLWLLHWQLFTPPVIATFWPLAMNGNVREIFSAKELTQAVGGRIRQDDRFNRFSSSSVEKDASCFLRMYSFSNRANSDEIECPFTSLDILLAGDKKNKATFNVEEKSSLPNSIFMASCFHYAAITQPKLRTLSLHKIVYDFNSPGVVFKLSESDVGRRIEESIREIPGVSFAESFGNRQLQFEHDPESIYLKLLDNYYANHT